MIHYWKKYLIHAILGYTAYMLYAVIFFYYAKSVHLQMGTFHYFVYSHLNFIIMGIALFYLSKAIAIKRAQAPRTNIKTTVYVRVKKE